MSQVQTSVEFSVELHRFINVDLFQRGFYQVRTTLRTSPRLPSKVEVVVGAGACGPLGGSAARSTAPVASTLGHYLLNAYIINGQTAVSKTFQILYKNEEIILDDVITFRVHSLVDGHRVKEQLSKGDFQLLVELWFTDQSFSEVGLHKRLQCVSSRQLILHFDALRGLHHHVPLVFDYFHLSGVTVTVHASLVALCQPAQGCGIAQWFGSSPRSRKLHAANQASGITMESVYFPPQGGVKKSIRQQRACLIHWEICLLMLSACGSLERRLVEYLRMLSPWQQMALDQLEALQLNANLCESLSELARLCIDYLKVARHQPPPWDKLFNLAKGISGDDDFLMLANSDIAQLCGALLVLWQQFLRVSLRQEKVKQQLARQRHLARVKRFGEAYFIIEKPRSAITAVCDAGSSLFGEVTEALRRSAYLNSIPPLDVECPEVDGDTDTLPIIYEEHYQEFKPTHLSSHQSASTSSVASPSSSTSTASASAAATGAAAGAAAAAGAVGGATTTTVAVEPPAPAATYFDSLPTRSIGESEMTVRHLLMKLNQHSNSKNRLKSRFLRQLKKSSRSRATSSSSSDAINNSESMPDLSHYTNGTNMALAERSDLAALNLNVDFALDLGGGENSTSSAESSANSSLKEEAKKKHHRKKIKHRRSISSSLVFAKLLQSGNHPTSSGSRKDSFDDSVFIQQAPSTVSTTSTTASTKTSSGYGGSSTPPGTPLPPEAFRDITANGGAPVFRIGMGPLPSPAAAAASAASAADGGVAVRCHSDPQSQRDDSPSADSPPDEPASQASGVSNGGSGGGGEDAFDAAGVREDANSNNNGKNNNSSSSNNNNGNSKNHNNSSSNNDNSSGSNNNSSGSNNNNNNNSNSRRNNNSSNTTAREEQLNKGVNDLPLAGIDTVKRPVESAASAALSDSSSLSAGTADCALTGNVHQSPLSTLKQLQLPLQKQQQKQQVNGSTSRDAEFKRESRNTDEQKVLNSSGRVRLPDMNNGTKSDDISTPSERNHHAENGISEPDEEKKNKTKQQQQPPPPQTTDSQRQLLTVVEGAPIIKPEQSKYHNVTEGRVKKTSRLESDRKEAVCNGSASHKLNDIVRKSPKCERSGESRPKQTLRVEDHRLLLNTVGTRSSSTNSSSSTVEQCAMTIEGTLFFPRPPREFTGDSPAVQPADDSRGKEKERKQQQQQQQQNCKDIKGGKETDVKEEPKSVQQATPRTGDGSGGTKGDPPSVGERTAEMDRAFIRQGLSKAKAVRPPPLACPPIDSNDSHNVESYLDAKCTIMEMLTDLQSKSAAASAGAGVSLHSGLLCDLDESEEDGVDGGGAAVRRASAIGSDLLGFVQAKEDFRQQLNLPSWLWCSDFPSLASTIPYFSCDPDLKAFSPDGLHLVICVHGLDGNSADLRLVRTYLELGLPTVNFEFLMSERNQGETFESFETLTDRLVAEILYHIQVYDLKPNRISFIGHSLGNIIIRSALTRPQLKPYLKKLHTFLSLSGPHLGTLFNNSGLVNMGMWFMQKWKKSGSLLQLAMRDAADIRSTFLYRLAQAGGLEHFKHVLLFGSSQDRYVPIHSARIELCKAAMKDSTNLGAAYREMIHNLLGPVMARPGKSCHFVRFDVHHALPTNTANSLIGRAAHVAVLDSELFIEKFMVVTGLRYFS